MSEDLNDHDARRGDGLPALPAGKSDPTGEDRARERDRGLPLAGSSTLNRLELGGPESAAHRYKRIAADADALAVRSRPHEERKPLDAGATSTLRRAGRSEKPRETLVRLVQPAPPSW